MTLAELQKILRAADKAAVLVSPRIIERVIREDCRLPNMYWNIPHARSYICDRQCLFRHAEQADLELEPDQLLPDTVLLLARPDPEELSNIERELVLLKYWRRLFHSRVHIALGAMDDSGPLTADGLRERIAAIGNAEFEEIRTVLFEDRYLPPEADDRTTYIEFAAVYLELRYFAANLLPNYFPGMRDFGQIERLLGQDVDADRLFICTRLRDAPDPIMTPDTRSDESQEAYWKLVRSAQGAALAGDTVEAAIQRMRASRIAPAALTLPTRNEAEADIANLSKRLAAALTLNEAETADWTRHLTLLLDKADQGARPIEARMLEDLQKVCRDHEQDVYTLDLVEWLMSGGKRPIKRPLPSQRLVRITKHLHSASQKLGEVRLSDVDRNQLGRLVGSSLHKSEEGLRARFGPVLVTALEDVGLRAHNPIERAAFDKMVGELLDRITSYGYLTFAELRDTISRNQLKLADPSEPEDFLLGDPLIRLDRRLASLLDGVYRPSEFYTRWLERGTSLLFGTWWGRPLCTFVLIPFATAWVCLHLLGLFLLWVVRSTVSYEKAPVVTDVGQTLYGPQVSHMVTDDNGLTLIPQLLAWHLGALFVAAFFLIALIHVVSFRRRCWHGLRAVWRTLRLLFWEAPLRIVPLATLQRIISTWVFQLVYWYGVKPAAVCLLFSSVLFNLHWTGILAVYAAAALLINSRVGRAVSESISDALVNVGTMVQAGLIPGLLRFFLHLFKQILELVEYVLFVVDEWLRFRSGEGRASLILRTMLGVLWYPFAFLARFYMVVLLEPGINPVKLPLSIMVAKVLLPVYPLLIGAIRPALSEALGAWPANALITFHLFWLPDVFVFLIWEMRENWSLYRANRPRELHPVVVGAHGETIRGLLEPGFHSGTVPRLYARLRRAERIATKSRNWQAARAFRQEIEEMAGTLRNFVAREMVALLVQSQSWRGTRVEAGQIYLATNRMRIELTHADYPVQPVEIEIEHRNGWLLAGVRANGWLEKITPEQLRAFCLCLGGLYKRSDVDLVREQIHRALPVPVASFQLTEEGLLAWSDLHDKPAYYPLREDLDRPDRAAEMQRMVFARMPIPWEQWVACWEKDQDGQGQPGLPGLSESLVRLTPSPPVAQAASV